MKNLVIFFLFTCMLFAGKIDTLLSDYQKASDHSNRTKDESVGNLIVYTRDMLDRMQAYTLKDLLKGLRCNQYIENRIGQSDPFNADPRLYNSMPMRIYLNDYELISSLFGSGVLWFGDMELDFIDHVEIYQGLPSLDIATEPAHIIIRLYSKTAEHDEGGRAQILGGSYGSNMQNLYYTQSFDKWDYFVYAGRHDDRRDTFSFDDKTLSRDKSKKHLFASVTTNHHRFEAHILNQKSDDFLGVAVAGIPLEAEGKLDYYNLSWQGNFLSDSLKINASYSNAKSQMLNHYSQSIAPLSSMNKFEQEYGDETLTLGVQKEFKLNQNTVKIGAQYRQKWFELEKLFANDMLYPFELEFDQKISALYIQDHYAFNMQNLLTVSYMHQYYDTKGSEVNSDSTNQFRLGYTFVDSSLISKSSISYQEQLPEPYTLIRLFHGNPDLKSSNILSFVQEFNFNYGDLQTDLIVGFNFLNNTVVVEDGQNKNADYTTYVNTQSIRVSYDFFERDLLEIILSRKQNYVSGLHNMTMHSALFRMLNSVNHYDFFNEIIINDAYKGDVGIDYSAGVRYHLNSDLTLSLKGENLFNSGLSWQYMTQPMPDPQYIEVSAIDRKVLVGLECLF